MALSALRGIVPKMHLGEQNLLAAMIGLNFVMAPSRGYTRYPLPEMALSPAQKSALSSSWKTLAKDTPTIQNNGAVLFSMLFKQFPDTRSHFPHFGNISEAADMKSQGVGKAHSMSVFSGIGAIIDSMEDPDCMNFLATKLTRNHLQRKIGSARFGEMRQVFGGFLDQALGGASADVKGAWDALLALLQDNLAAEEKK